jgi:hypothetical protein
MIEQPDVATVQIYFSDFFDVCPALVEDYGAFDVSLINDLPLFIDPFLLFNSPDPAYQQLHANIIRYLLFLRDRAGAGGLDRGLLRAWYQFGEVKQTWLGFSQAGNRGSGLGADFARSLHDNLSTIFTDFGQEKITRGSHLEKVCLVAEGIGRDNISDFTTNLIKEYMLEYTQAFALAHLRPEQRRTFVVDRVRFNYNTETWERGQYELPYHASDFVLLTPKDMLTRDEIWISRPDLRHNFEQIAAAVSDPELRALLNNYLYARLSHDPKMTEREKEQKRRRAIDQTIRAHPEVIEYYIREKEDTGDRAEAISSEKVAETEEWFVRQLRAFVAARLVGTEFYELTGDTYEEARERVHFLKHVIEDQDGYRIFWHDGRPVQREQDLQLLFKLTWFGTPSDVNSEVNNGRGPVDFKVSRGSADRSLVEFKLASNSKLKRNLAKQVAIYERASDAHRSLKVICYFSALELARVQAILRELALEEHPDIILIDARADNKPSASRA